MSAFGFGDGGWGVYLLRAAATTLAVTLAALLVGAVLGGLAAGAKLSRRRLPRLVGDLYTTLFRGIPELLIIFLFYFGGSAALTGLWHAVGREGFLSVPTFLAGSLAVGTISGAYQAEVFRGAYGAIAPGELEAARAMGFGGALRFRRVVVPQVLRFALPGLGNVWQLSLKDSALVSVTGLIELMRGSQVAAGSTRNYFGFYIAGGVLYLAMTAVSGRLFAAAERRTGRAFRRERPRDA